MMAGSLVWRADSPGALEAGAGTGPHAVWGSNIGVVRSVNHAPSTHCGAGLPTGPRSPSRRDDGCVETGSLRQATHEQADGAGVTGTETFAWGQDDGDLLRGGGQWHWRRLYRAGPSIPIARSVATRRSCVHSFDAEKLPSCYAPRNDIGDWTSPHPLSSENSSGDSGRQGFADVPAGFQVGGGYNFRCQNRLGRLGMGADNKRVCDAS
jgi:hypothetical protein